jgi:hypothetical protein
MSAMHDEIVQFLNAYILEYNPYKGYGQEPNRLKATGLFRQTLLD